MLDGAGFAVEQFWRANDFPAECRADGLMAQAHAQDGKLSCEAPDELDANAGILRRARARRNHDAVWPAPGDFLDGNLVVSMDFDIASELAEILRQVVGEGIVVVEQENHDVPWRCPRCADSRAVSRARDLFTLS